MKQPPDLRSLLGKIMSPKHVEYLMNMYITHDSDKYTMFGKYKINQSNGAFIVERMSDFSIHEFSELKSAAAWCIMDRSNRVYESNQLKQLDQKLSGIILESAQHRRIAAAATDTETYLIHQTKIEELSYQLKNVSSRLNRMIEYSKRIQSAKFDAPKQILHLR